MTPEKGAFRVDQRYRESKEIRNKQPEDEFRAFSSQHSA
jgi:hypothetical protein